jgi:hypothetical protein
VIHFTLANMDYFLKDPVETVVAFLKQPGSTSSTTTQREIPRAVFQSRQYRLLRQNGMTIMRTRKKVKVKRE